MKNIPFLVVLCIGFHVTPLNADQIIKRVKCADHDSPINQRQAFINLATTSLAFTLQIARDNCRPKISDGGLFNFVWHDGTLGRSAGVLRAKRDAVRIGGHLGSNRSLFLYFSPPIGLRASGTFDYVLTVH